MRDCLVAVAISLACVVATLALAEIVDYLFFTEYHCARWATIYPVTPAYADYEWSALQARLVPVAHGVYQGVGTTYCVEPR